MTIYIEDIIQGLIGLRLTQTSRSSNVECLKFGFKENKKKNIGKFGLHIQTSWRIVSDETILVGSNDLFEPNSVNESKLDFDYEEGNLRDEKLMGLLSLSNLSVSQISSDKFGGLNIQFHNKMELQIIPTTSSKCEYNEFWRLIDNRNSESKHIVARISGLVIE